MATCLERSNSTGVIGLALRYSGSTRFQAPSKSPQRIAADQAYCASCSLSSLLPMLAQPAASSTTAMASQQCFIIRIAFLLPGSGVAARVATPRSSRSEEHTSELQSLMRISYAVLCLKKKNKNSKDTRHYAIPTHNNVQTPQTSTTQHT